MPYRLEGPRQPVKGNVVERGDSATTKPRAVFNGMIDKHPAAIAYCVDEADVAAAIGFARKRGLRLAVRGGGHNGAERERRRRLVIDLSAMNASPWIRPHGWCACRAARRSGRSTV